MHNNSSNSKQFNRVQNTSTVGNWPHYAKTSRYSANHLTRGILLPKSTPRRFPSYLLLTLLLYFLIFYLPRCTLPDFSSVSSLTSLLFLSCCHRTTTTPRDIDFWLLSNWRERIFLVNDMLVSLLKSDQFFYALKLFEIEKKRFSGKHFWLSTAPKKVRGIESWKFLDLEKFREKKSPK